MRKMIAHTWLLILMASLCLTTSCCGTAPANTAPTASNPFVTVIYNTAHSITLAATDTDNGPQTSLTYSIATQPQHGTLSGTAPNLSYMPTTTYSGSDSFTFTANDGAANSNVATVSIFVTLPLPSKALIPAGEFVMGDTLRKYKCILRNHTR